MTPGSAQLDVIILVMDILDWSCMNNQRQKYQSLNNKSLIEPNIVLINN
jgi:hypothetical protein